MKVKITSNREGNENTEGSPKLGRGRSCEKYTLTFKHTLCAQLHGASKLFSESFGCAAILLRAVVKR